jgi:hypothetical protein
MSQTRTAVTVERVTFRSRRTFDEVIEGIYREIGRPELDELIASLAAARDHDEYQALVRAATGPSGLMRFLHLNQAAAFAKNPEVTPFRLVRIIAGNPVMMGEMARYVADAASYAPVTILVYEAPDGVRACYDTIASALRPYGDERALKVAEELDRKVLNLLSGATGPAEPGAAAE